MIDLRDTRTSVTGPRPSCYSIICRLASTCVNCFSDRLLALHEGLVSWTDTSYVNLEIIGTGGTAQTHLMLATSGPCKGVPFAVKIFRRPSRPEWRFKFMREINFL